VYQVNVFVNRLVLSVFKQDIKLLNINVNVSDFFLSVFLNCWI